MAFPSVARRIVLTMLTLAIGPKCAEAAAMLDQSYVATGNVASQVFDNQSVAQTFTVGITGTLTHVKAQVGTIDGFDYDAPLSYAIRSLSFGKPSTVLTSGTIAAADLPDVFLLQMVLLDFADLAVTAGQQFALVISAPLDGAAYGWMANKDAGYAAGYYMTQATAIGSGWSLPYVSTVDAGFQTYVEPAGSNVPEPHAAALLLAGLVACARRRLVSRP